MVYRLHKRTRRPALCLPINGRMRLVIWDQGEPVVFPVQGRVRYSPDEPDILSVCKAWGITLAQLDEFVERAFYSVNEDVLAVRAIEAKRL